MYITIPPMSAACCARSSGAARSPLPAPASGMKRRSAPGVTKSCRRSKKSASAGQTVIWIDEAGFYQLPGRVRTYAPRGQTPLLRLPLTRDHLAVICALTAEGRLLQRGEGGALTGGGVGGLFAHFMRPGTAEGRLLQRVQERPFTAEDIVAFLAHVLRQVPGAVLVIWDGAPIHRAKVVKEFLKSQEGQRLWLERLPGYAPELNPVEGIWNY